MNGNKHYHHNRQASEPQACLIIETPYGRGCVVRRRKRDADDMQEIELLEWPLASRGLVQKYATLYSKTNYAPARPMMHDDVMTAFGRGRVEQIIGENHTIVVSLTSWRLNGRSKVRCYLNVKSSVQVLRKKTVFEMDSYERVEYAFQKKNEANVLFQQHQYQQALLLYSQAVQSVRSVQHTPNSSNCLRADLLYVMITCCNNAAACATHMNQWNSTKEYCGMALALLDALHEKHTSSKVYDELSNHYKLTPVKLFGEWRVKALYRLGQAYHNTGEIDSALDVLKRAHELVVDYSGDSSSADKQLAIMDKQVQKLRAKCLQHKKKNRNKEKQRAMAMFGSPSKENTNINGDKKKDGTTIENRNKSATTGADESSPTASRSTGGLLDSSSMRRVEQEHETSSNKATPAFPTRRVSFSEHLEHTKEYDLASHIVGGDNIEHQSAYHGEEDDEEHHHSFLNEHKEALILSAAASGILALSFLLLRKR